MMAAERRTLYLVDGSGYVFRAFFALPSLTTSRGLPTNAAYGFARMLLKLLKETRPTHIAIVFDSAKKTFRDDLFEAYKANRPAAPSDLVAQIPYIHRIVDALGIRKIIEEGVEADDVIASIALAAQTQKFNIIIVTADKDFMQLVSPSITLWDTMRDRKTGLRDVRERFGVEPAAVVDIMALTGDPIDNVKGVPGIGEKTAAALIEKFGSIEKLLASLDSLERSDMRGAKKLASAIAEHRGAIELAKKLVCFHTELKVAAEPEQLARGAIDAQAAAQVLRELEFTSLLAEVAPPNGVKQAAPRQVEVAAEGLEAALNSLLAAPRISLHLAEDGSACLKLYAEGANETLVLARELIPGAARLLEAPSPPKACHDLKGHLRRLERFGVGLGGVDFDTMLAGFLINPGRAEPTLDDLYHEHLALLGSPTDQRPEPELVAALREALRPRLQSEGLEQLFDEIELPVARILAAMESYGVAVESDGLKAMSRQFAEQLAILERQCFELAGEEFNLNSPAQLREILFHKLGLSARGLKKTKSGYSTDVDTLNKLAPTHPLPAKVLEYRVIAKLKSTYSDALQALVDPASGRIHTCFHQALTATGRLSSTNPNLQNIPTRSDEGRRIRRAFVAPAGRILLSADYSQIELRILAHLSRDPTLLDAFWHGEDIHVRTACEVLGIEPNKVNAEARRIAKVINFGIIYGIGPQRLADGVGISVNEASDYIRRYFERLAGVRAYLDESLSQARQRGFVTTMFGRRRYLPELSGSEGGARAQAERIAINTPIQGAAADLIKLAMVKLERELKALGIAAQMVLQVHDELLFELDEGGLEALCQVAKRQMEGAAQLAVPLKVDLSWGKNWAELAA